MKTKLLHDGDGYIALCNAVVEQAAADYVRLKTMQFEHPATYKDSSMYASVSDAERFLKSKDLMKFTDVSGQFLIKKLDLIVRKIVVDDCYKNFVEMIKY